MLIIIYHLQTTFIVHPIFSLIFIVLSPIRFIKFYFFYFPLKHFIIIYIFYHSLFPTQASFFLNQFIYTINSLNLHLRYNISLPSSIALYIFYFSLNIITYFLLNVSSFLFSLFPLL